MRTPKHCFLKAITLDAVAGAQLGDVLKEGWIISVEEGVPVYVQHNGREYPIHAHELLNIWISEAIGPKVDS